MAPRRQAALAAAAVSTSPFLGPALPLSRPEHPYPSAYTFFRRMFPQRHSSSITARVLFHCHLPHAPSSSALLLGFICWLLPFPCSLGLGFLSFFACNKTIGKRISCPSFCVLVT
ncbi:hypothetical protein CGRA01v4_05787 [Colletotrichum graminicola]|nr:hypothetical protein CGRA01v4_05787 [Colletotrichum graminicola]